MGEHCEKRLLWKIRNIKGAFKIRKNFHSARAARTGYKVRHFRNFEVFAGRFSYTFFPDGKYVNATKIPSLSKIGEAQKEFEKISGEKSRTPFQIQNIYARGRLHARIPSLAAIKKNFDE